MKPISLGNCCNQEQLVSLLAGQLGQHDSDLALSHIEQCDVCRKSMENLSGDESDWNEAREILSSSKVFGPKPPDDWSQSLSKRLLSPSSHPEMLGRIGRYDIESMLGAGGMGIVYRGFDTQLQRAVAIKVLSPTLAFHGSARQRFAKEAQAAAGTRRVVRKIRLCPGPQPFTRPWSLALRGSMQTDSIDGMIK